MSRRCCRCCTGHAPRSKAPTAATLVCPNGCSRPSSHVVDGGTPPSPSADWFSAASGAPSRRSSCPLGGCPDRCVSGVAVGPNAPRRTDAGEGALSSWDDPAIDHGRPPLGFRSDEAGERWVANPEEFENALQAVTLLDQGSSLREVSRGTGIPKSSVARIRDRREPILLKPNVWGM